MRDVKLWVRLAIITLGLVVPLGTVLVATLVTEREEALAASRDSLRKLAKLAAEQEDDAIEEASNLVRVLALVPDVTNANPDACHAILRELVNEHPRIEAVMVGKPDGAVACESEAPVPRKATMAGREWFKQVTAPNAPTIVTSDHVSSLVTGRLTLVISTPLRTANGIGSLSAGIDLGSFSTLGERFGSEAGAVMTVVSVPTGTVLASSDTHLRPIGSSFGNSELLEMLRGRKTGVYEDRGRGLNRRIYGFALLPWTGGAQAAVLVSRTRDGVVGPANRRLLVSLALLGVIVVLGALISMGLAFLLVWRPLRQLVVTAQALGHGELHARASLTRVQDPECRALAIALNEMAGQLAEREQALAALATRDGLTGLANRRRFDAALDEAWNVAPAPLALVMIDVDFFKPFNDLYGHQEGDNALRLVAQALCATVRHRYDLVARYGGEEFVVLLPGLDLADAEIVGNRLVVTTRSLEIPHRGSPSGFLTISAGVAWVIRSPSGPTSGDLLKVADDALYIAKRSGRNRMVLKRPAIDLPAGQKGENRLRVR